MNGHLLAKDLDLIPEYYIDRMKRNFAGRDANKQNHSPSHKFNRYGDELEITKLGLMIYKTQEETQ